MAYTAGNLHLLGVAPGDCSYTYDAGSDTMATVITAGYFNNTDDALGLAVDDLVWCQCTDGNVWVRVSALSSGSVTVQFAGGNLPIQTHATGTAAPQGALLSVGYYEVGTSIATASRSVLPTPYPGAEVRVRKVDSGTMNFGFDAGASDSEVSVGLGGGTGVTYDSVGNRRIILRFEGESFHAVGSSTSRWRLYDLNNVATGDGCASVFPQEGATQALGSTGLTI